MFDKSDWHALSNGTYQISHTTRALDDDNGKIASNGFNHILK
jgi:hypothetical protein